MFPFLHISLLLWQVIILCPKPLLILKISSLLLKLWIERLLNVKTWVLDTRAGDYIVCSVTFLHSITSITHCFVELPNGESTQVTHIGSVHLSSHLTLEHVLCVPSFSFNLLYVSKLTQWLLFTFYYCPNFVFFSTLLVGERLEWVKLTMVYTCYRIPPLRHQAFLLPSLNVFPLTSISTLFTLLLLLPAQTCPLFGILD